jgi:hypothetical protein
LVVELWDFLDGTGRNAITEWGRQQTKRDQARLDQKLDRLAQMDFELAIGTKLLAGSINKQKHIYKVRIHGDVQLRPMLCRGPRDVHGEYTLLLGAIEKGSVLTPNAAAAEANRVILLRDIDGHRCRHVAIRQKK